MTPCPWCQKQEAGPRCVGMHERIPGVPLFQVACACGARGPVHTEASAAEEAWNAWGEPVVRELVEALEGMVGRLALRSPEERQVETRALIALRNAQSLRGGQKNG